MCATPCQKAGAEHARMARPVWSGPRLKGRSRRAPCRCSARPAAARLRGCRAGIDIDLEAKCARRAGHTVVSRPAAAPRRPGRDRPRRCACSASFMSTVGFQPSSAQRVADVGHAVLHVLVALAVVVVGVVSTSFTCAGRVAVLGIGLRQLQHHLSPVRAPNNCCRVADVVDLAGGDAVLCCR